MLISHVTCKQRSSLLLRLELLLAELTFPSLRVLFLFVHFFVVRLQNVAVEKSLLAELALRLQGDLFAILKGFEGSNFFGEVFMHRENMVLKFFCSLILDEAEGTFLFSNIDL